MIVTRTPFRISFVGGGSDMETFYSRHQGAVLSTSINKYMYISTHKYFFPDQIRVKYSKTETVHELKKLRHPLLREAMLKTGVQTGIEISSIADIPAGTGMGSSSSFTVGTLHNLYTVKHQKVTHETLAREACDIEIGKLGEPIGKQDQYAAAYGDLNIIYFNTDGTVRIEPMNIKDDMYRQLQRNLIMFYTGTQRKASDILSEQKQNATRDEKFQTLKSMVLLVSDLSDCLYKENLDDFGRILHENWILKQKLASQISNSEIEKIYEAGISGGATGGKLLGAGGGGFMLFYCEEKKQPKLIERLKALSQLDFSFEREGSKILYNDNEEF
jgi:D-glycero-alpha-D-manno-heptose-7-phosphate kinase